MLPPISIDRALEQINWCPTSNNTTSPITTIVDNFYFAQGKQEIQEISYAKTPEQYGMRNYQNMGEEYTLCIPFLLT